MSIKDLNPEIRFGGFTDAWEQREFGNAFKQRIDYLNPQASNVELWSLTVEKGLTPKTERYIRDFLVTKEDKFKAVKSGDIVYNPMNMTLGAIGYNDIPKTVAVSGYYVSMEPICDIDGYFIYTLMRTTQTIESYKMHATGSLLEKQRVQYPVFSCIRFRLPNLAEQKLIGDYFHNLDNLITLHQRKYDKLADIKKSMLEKMFPKDGANVPEIRFNGFSGAWEQRKFSDMYEKVSEKNNLSYKTDRIISVANMYFKADAYITDEEYLRTYNMFKLGDIAFEGNKSKKFAHGRFVENTIGDGIVSHVFDVFRPKMTYDLLFWKYAINNEILMKSILIRCTKASTMMTNLVANDFLNEKFQFPCIEEQKRIGEFLNSLDYLITLHQRELEKLKNIKKAMLNKMFV